MLLAGSYNNFCLLRINIPTAIVVSLTKQAYTSHMHCALCIMHFIVHHTFFLLKVVLLLHEILSPFYAGCQNIESGQETVEGNFFQHQRRSSLVMLLARLALQLHYKTVTVHPCVFLCIQVLFWGKKWFNAFEGNKKKCFFIIIFLDIVFFGIVGLRSCHGHHAGEVNRYCPFGNTLSLNKSSSA